MTQYLNSKLVDIAFKRLSPKTSTGKKPLERTSALMYFLAFDAAAKERDCCPLDLSPNTAEGKNNRQAVELEFVRLVKLKSAADLKVRQISVLGKVETGGTSPEKRISSNFFTVPVKKGSESAKAYNYPSRPASLLKFGGTATGLKWGADYHADWMFNLPKFLSDVKSNTPFTDLAIFVFRDGKVGSTASNIREALIDSISVRFSEELGEFWIKQINAEKVFFKHGDDPFRGSYKESLAEDTDSTLKSQTSDSETLKSLDQQLLVDRILYLEGLLDAKEIEYQSVSK